MLIWQRKEQGWHEPVCQNGFPEIPWIQDLCVHTDVLGQPHSLLSKNFY